MKSCFAIASALDDLLLKILSLFYPPCYISIGTGPMAM